VGSTDGGGSLVMTGFGGIRGEKIDGFVLAGSWAFAREGKASAHSDVSTKTHVILEEF